MSTPRFRMITIVCMSAEHEGRTATVGVFVPNGRGEWNPRADNTSDGEQAVLLTGDTVVGGQPREHFRPLDARRRYRLECSLCGVTLPVTGEKLDEALDHYWERGKAAKIVSPTGVLGVPLGALGARVSSKS